MSSRFGEMLLNRRRELGMSIQQVANVIKIRPQIIEFFETGNFASMPPRGYAQGMIASYARYLGLNPREVVNAYFDELYVYERGGTSAGSQFTEGATNPVPRSVSTSGRYLMVDPVPASRFAQRPPQAGYVSDSTSGHVPMPVAGNVRRYASLPEGAPRRFGDSPASRRGGDGEYSRGRDLPRSGSAGRTMRMRRVPEGEGRSSRYASGASRRPSADSSSRRRSSRQAPSRGRSSGRSQGRRNAAPTIFDDPRVMIGAIVIAVVILLVAIILLVRGCTAAPSTQQTPETPAVSTGSTDGSAATDDTTSKDDAADDDSSASASDADGDSDADANADGDSDGDTADSDSDAAADAQAVPTKTTVTVSLEEGASSWVEVKVDGSLKLSEQVAGPFEMDFTPESSIEVTVDHPGDVRVTKNGDSVEWDTKTSGVGRLTISVPKSTDEGASDGSSDDSSDSSTDVSDTSDDSYTDESYYDDLYSDDSEM